MPHLRRVHSFRDHPFAGVNWRPTRFVDEVPSSRVCGLCRMIATRTVLLPCSHILCQSCHAASPQGGSSLCPLDQEPFEEAQCFCYVFSTRKDNAFKPDAVPLFSVAGTNNTSSKSRAMTLQDMTAALQELKTLLRNDHKQLLLAIQCSMNEVIGQIRSQEYTFARLYRRCDILKWEHRVPQPRYRRELLGGIRLRTPARRPHHAPRNQRCLVGRNHSQTFHKSRIRVCIHTAMPDLRRVHRFRDHPIAGVNWRPIRFVDEVSTSRVCGLCGMIPNKTVILPCNSQGCGGRCPFDQEPFEEAECVSYDLPTRRANALKVHCWNEEHGCEFEGAVELMLRHYENECTFHAVECLRCGEKVQHRALSTHYAAGCRGAVSSPRSEHASSDSQALTLQDATAALEELKRLLRNANHEQLLLAIQTQMNALIEQTRNQGGRPAVITHDVAALASSQMDQVAAPSTSTSLQERTSRQNPTEESQINEPIGQVKNQEPRTAVITHAVAAPATSKMAQVAAPTTSKSLQEGTFPHNQAAGASTSSTLNSCSEATLIPQYL
ncbi:hypothetical protein HPB52_006852 [Rhipicephalus sanguineus]|uniref:RING-type domain-containing protein n=1 Tax=Rhipicephalus sanguineus TaxID=34632 RepID=A0A9D4T772_RHISA|nr:hypothetical protein HPB52_006852 [Rhipicephalus sanguineus]